MRKLILDKIKKEIENGDDEIVEEFGDFVKISQMSDENLLNVYDFISPERKTPSFRAGIQVRN